MPPGEDTPRWLAPSIPDWVMLDREGLMYVDKRILTSVAFLGTKTERGFYADGTGFLFRVADEDEGLSFVYLVSCRHVVVPFTGGSQAETPNDEPIWIRVNRTGKEPKLYPTKRSDWICHPRSKRVVDICVHEVPLRQWEAEDDVEIGVLSEADLFTPERELKEGRLALGDDLFMPALFTGRPGEKRNIPVFRTATLAALADEPVPVGSPYHPAYLAETRSLGGTSGAPVFVHTAAAGRHLGSDDEYLEVWKNLETGAIETPYYLIGMMAGSHSGAFSFDFVQDDNTVLPKDGDFNAGIGVVLPYPLILEVINHPILEKRRMAEIAENRKRSGYRPASSKPPGGKPVDDANPQGKEDFTRLLGAAAKKTKQGD